MRRYLLATTFILALAADLPANAAAHEAPSIAAPTWTGFYVGANVGGGWGTRDVNYSANDPATTTLFGAFGGMPSSTSLSTSGLLGGLQIGYNWQFAPTWLIGIEADFDWSDMKGDGSSRGPSFAGVSSYLAPVDEHVKWFGTVRARLGYLLANNLLAYITGGFAYGRVEHTGSYSNNSGFSFAQLPIAGFSYNCFAGTTCFSGSSSGVATGWTLGGGLEYALWKNFTLKAEYLYVSLDSRSVTETALSVPIASSTPASFNANFNHTTFNVARVGLNYRF